MKKVLIKGTLSIQPKSETIYTSLAFDIGTDGNLDEIKPILENTLKENLEFKSLILNSFDISQTLSSGNASIVIKMEIPYNKNNFLNANYIRAMYRNVLVSFIDKIHIYFQLNPRNTRIRNIKNTTLCDIELHEEGVYSYVPS